jgi:hypothetical protein
MSNTIVTCTDGFQWKIVSAVEAKQMYKDDREVFVLDDDNNEYLVDDVAKFDDDNLRFAVELGFKKRKGSNA